MNKIYLYLLLFFNIGTIYSSDQSDPCDWVGFYSAHDLSQFSRAMYNSNLVPWKKSLYFSGIIQSATTDLELFGEESKYYHHKYFYPNSIKHTLLNTCNTLGMDETLNRFEDRVESWLDTNDKKFGFIICTHMVFIREGNVKNAANE